MKLESTNSAAPPPLADLAAADGFVPRDLPCRKCSYNLRGLAWSGLCPECATPIVLSGQSDMLRFSDPRWVRQLAWGATLLLVATLLFFLGTAVSYARFLTVMRSMSFNLLLYMPAAAAMAAGVWLITQPDPARGDHDAAPRMFLRAGAIFILASRLLFLSFGSRRSGTTVATIMQITGIIVTFLRVGIEFGVLLYIARLARRIPSDWIDRRAALLRLLVPLGMSVNALLNIAIVLVMWNLGAGSYGVVSSIAMFISIVNFGMLFLWGAEAHLQWKLSQSLRLQTVIARQIWSNASSSAATTPAPA
jgi:hypothetical protein